MKLSNKNIQEIKEQKYKDQIVFMAMLGTAMALRDNHISEDRTVKIINDMMNKVAELSEYLNANLCIYKDKNKPDVDYEYNRETLKRLASEYNIKFDETMFNV